MLVETACLSKLAHFLRPSIHGEVSVHSDIDLQNALLYKAIWPTTSVLPAAVVLAHGQPPV